MDRLAKRVAEVKDLHTPNPSVINHLEKLLAYAKAGTLRSIADVCEWDDGSVGNGYAISRHAQRVRLIGELHVLAHHLIVELDP